MSNLRPFARNWVLRSKEIALLPLWSTIWSEHLEFLWFETKNWGDALNPVLIEKLSTLKARGVDINLRLLEPLAQDSAARTLYMVIGSVMQYADCQTVIWGAGFTSNYNQFRQAPKKILAVRGPLSANHSRALGVDCPDIYGDPALLWPRFYQPDVKKSYKLGIIPHHLERNDPILKQFKEHPEVLLIDIKTSIDKLVDLVCSCERIASSSLHGLILSDAYNIPSGWIGISDKIPGKDFKFKDYYASIGLPGLEKTHLQTFGSKIAIKQIHDLCHAHEVKLDLDRLLEVCPF